jgi:hypothetical protein
MIEVDGVPAEPLRAGEYYTIPRESTYRIDCLASKCFVVARRFEGDGVSEADTVGGGPVEQADRVDVALRFVKR